MFANVQENEKKIAKRLIILDHVSQICVVSHKSLTIVYVFSFRYAPPLFCLTETAASLTEMQRLEKELRASNAANLDIVSIYVQILSLYELQIAKDCFAEALP